MKKRLQIIISCLLALCLMQGLFLLAAGALTDNQYTMTADDYGEFCEMLSTLTHNRGQEKSAQTRSDLPEDDFASMRVIVRAEGSAPDLTGFGAVCSIKGPDGFFILQFDSERGAEGCVNALRGKSGIKYAVPDTKVWLCEEEVDAAQAEKAQDDEAAETTHLSWGAGYLELDLYADRVAETAGASDTVTVAVVDSGVAHHDLLDPVVTADGMDFVGSDPRDDEHGHGTHVAGIIADCTQGLNVEIMSVRVLGADGSGFTSSVVAGIEYAVSMGADVINYSIAGAHDESKDDAVDDAVENGITFVCASGNNGKSIDSFNYCPSHNDNAIVVGAITQSGTRCSFSNYGSTQDVVAPGNQIISCGLNNDTTSKSGTSMATAFISAIAAIYKIDNPTATVEDTDCFIKEFSCDLGDDGFDFYYGFGVPKLSGAYYSEIFTWRSNSDGIEITGILDETRSRVVPQSIGGRRVTGIGDSAFMNRDTLQSISLPDGLEYIGTGAFLGCAELSDINIPDSVTSVGEYAFFDCDSLLRLRFGALTSSLGDYCAGYTGSVSEPFATACFVVEGYTGTAAESYADDNGLLFEESQKIQITSDDERLYMAQGDKTASGWTTYPSSLSGLCEVSLSSSDISVVRPSSGLMLTAVGAGNAEVEITASYNGDTSSCTLYVTVVGEALDIVNDSVTMLFKETKALTVNINLPGYTSDDIVWSTENSAVATVSSDGVVTAAGRGTTTVKASTSDGHYSAECTVTVNYTLWQWFIIVVLFGWIWYR